MRLINKKNIGIFKALVKGFMKCQEPFTHIVEVNNRELKPCIYVMWHSDQFCIYGIEDKSHLSVLISNSIDGEIVAYATEALGFKTVRGSSKKKGAVEATMQMLTRLKNGECVKTQYIDTSNEITLHTEELSELLEGVRSFAKLI